MPRLCQAITICSMIISPLVLRAQSVPAKSTDFKPLELWQAAVLSDNALTLQQLYAGAHIGDPMQHTISVDDELHFWHKIKADGLSQLTLDVAKVEEGPANSTVVSFETEMQMRTPSGTKSGYIMLTQVWSGDEKPKILAEMRSPMRRLKQPMHLNPKLYDTAADAHAEIREALARAGKQHKRVLLVFGGNWCYDCHVLDLAFHDPEIRPVLDRNYVVVHVDVGEYNKNLDLAKQYSVPLEKGVPALVVLDHDGTLLFSQHGEFESARSLSPDDILSFLNKWKPTA